MNYNILFAKNKFSSFIFILQAKMTYSTILETKTELENFHLPSIAFPPNLSLFPQSKAK